MRGHVVCEGILWLSTRARPDLAFAVSSAAQVLTKGIELLLVKMRHLLQYLSTTQALGLLYLCPKNGATTEFTVYIDVSFAPSGRQSQSGDPSFLWLYLTPGTLAIDEGK